MKLFGKDKDNQMKQEAETALQLVEQKAIQKAEAEIQETAAEAASLVLDIEGADSLPKEEPVADLRGATKTLPDPKEINEALPEVKAIVEEPAEAAAEAAPEVVPSDEEHPDGSPVSEEAAEEAPAGEPEPAEKPLSAVSYESVAEAMESAKKEPTGRFARDAVDDETLLAELYALIGDGGKTKPKPAQVESDPESKPHIAPTPRPVARITPETLQAVPEEYEEITEDDSTGVPGWLKGVFILLISLLLSAMTFYAVASDVIGKIF